MAETAAAAPGLRILLHQHQKERAPVHVSCHADRDRVIEIFKNAIQLYGPPSEFALRTMQEAIKPQKQTVLVQDENQSLENALRTLLQELVSSAVQSGERVMQFGKPIDDQEYKQGQIPRLLVPLPNCETMNWRYKIYVADHSKAGSMADHGLVNQPNRVRLQIGFLLDFMQPE